MDGVCTCAVDDREKNIYLSVDKEKKRVAFSHANWKTIIPSILSTLVGRSEIVSFLFCSSPFILCPSSFCGGEKKNKIEGEKERKERIHFSKEKRRLKVSLGR